MHSLILILVAAVPHEAPSAARLAERTSLRLLAPTVETQAGTELFLRWSTPGLVTMEDSLWEAATKAPADSELARLSRDLQDTERRTEGFSRVTLEQTLAPEVSNVIGLTLKI